MAVDQKLSQFSHDPDSREPQPLPARLSVDVTAKSVVRGVFIISNPCRDGSTDHERESPAVAPQGMSANDQQAGW